MTSSNTKSIMPTVNIHPIATRKEHNVSHNELVSHVSKSHETWTQGDRDGVFHCALPKEWVCGEIVTLRPNELYEAKITFSARKGVDEEPRQEIKINANPDPVESADCIIYTHALLGKDASSDADFEIIAIRGLTSTPNPRALNTLLHNIFNLTGGSPVEGTAEEKLEMIRQSFMFWKDKAMAM